MKSQINKISKQNLMQKLIPQENILSLSELNNLYI